MKLFELYKKAIAAGIDNDPRAQTQLSENLNTLKKDTLISNLETGRRRHRDT